MTRPIKAIDLLELDPQLETVMLQGYPIPEQVIYQAARNDYSETPIHHQTIPDANKCGEWVVETLLSNDKGHFGCYSSDTEVLTDKGWVFWPEVTKDTVLAAFDLESGLVNFEIPSAVQRWDYEGKMYYSEELDLLVSPDHRIIFKQRENQEGEFKLKILTAEEFYNRKQKGYEMFLIPSEDYTMPGGFSLFKTFDESWVDYKGTIHCATVSTGALIVKRKKERGIVCGNCLEHPQITFSVSGYVHSVMVQARTHRIATFDCQSQRYTGKRVLKVANGELDVEDVFYVRPVGFYTNRQGRKYDWTEEHRQRKLERIVEECVEYSNYYEQGMCEEHLRDYLPQAIRQNFVVSVNLRSVLHFMDLRAKMDAQLEIQALCLQMAPILQNWAPHVWDYYVEKRLHKARLAP